MDGIEKITNRISSEAKAFADELLAEAQKSADAIAEQYGQKAAAVYESKMLAGKNDISQQAQHAGRAASLEARKIILSAKQELISEAYARAKAAIIGMPDDEYAAFLARQASDAAADGEGEIILNAADRARVGDKVAALANAIAAERGVESKLVLSDTTEDISGGLILRNGKKSANCTLDSLIELSRSSMDAIVAGVLFN